MRNQMLEPNILRQQAGYIFGEDPVASHHFGVLYTLTTRASPAPSVRFRSFRGYSRRGYSRQTLRF